MSENNILDVTDLISAIKGITFPYNKENLINKVNDNNASQDILDMIEGIERDFFNSLTEVTKGLNKENDF